MTRQVYAFAGKRSTGKSTASGTLMEMGFVDVKFADPLKNMLRAFYTTCGVDANTAERKLEGDLKEVPCEWLQGKTPRYAMQTLGTEWRDLISTNLWSAIFVKRIQSGSLGDKIVCSDFRFPHEARVLDSLGAFTYRIERPDLVDDEVSIHVSESGIADVPVNGVIYNTGSAADLRQQVLDLVALNEAISEVPLEVITAYGDYA